MERSRRSVLFSLPPLWLIGVCVFLPTVRCCERMESPASLVYGGPYLFAGLLAPFFVAELLANRTTPRLTAATVVLVFLSAASGSLFGFMSLWDKHSPFEHAWGVLMLTLVAAGLVMLVRARFCQSWARQADLYAAFTVFALCLAIQMGRVVAEDGLRHLGIGGWLYLAAVAALVVVQGLRLVGRRDGPTMLVT
jgi:hypothetical protein